MTVCWLIRSAAVSDYGVVNEKPLFPRQGKSVLNQGWQWWLKVLFRCCNPVNC